ncbi:MAG TPA: lipoyl synthase [Thermodesulfobacteriota bacterium]|nr:lipoyl synthase [Thermodesulfobacteriota bacterium]
MKPEWLRRKLPDPEVLSRMRTLLKGHGLNTVCEGAMCPNQGECFGRGTATFLILGRTCTRNCTFCAIPTEARPPLPDPKEPESVARAAAELKLKHVVITSVTRDDLEDGGAGHFALTVRELKKNDPDIVVEILIPDFRGSRPALETVVTAGADILNHNMETVPRLYPEVRPQAVYSRSIEVLKMVKEIDPGMVTKSGLMLGLGEEFDEVLRVMADLREAGCDLLTLGQYLRPSGNHHAVARYVTPEEFDELRVKGEAMGFKAVFSAPLVRSSFHADEVFEKIIQPQRAQSTQR